jgi:uncharacterized membrane protein
MVVDVRDKSQNLIMGMEKEEYNRRASAHSKANIILWVIGGVAFNVYEHNLISISTILLVIPGIFIASFASLTSFLIDVKKYQIVPKTNNVFVLLLFTVWYVVDFVSPIILSIGYILLIEYLFNFLKS